MKQADRTLREVGAPSAVPAGRYVVFFAIAVCGCALDLLTKQWVFSWLGEPPPPGAAASDHTWWLCEGYFGFQTAVNTGALFGLGKGGSPWFAALSIAAALAIAGWLFYGRAAHDLSLTVTLALVCAGILGNLYDRLGLWDNRVPEHAGGVRDWILMQIPGYPPWPNYNLADCMLVCGAALLMWHAFWHGDRRPQAGAAGTDGC